MDRLQELALSLSLKCLSFDFVGTSIDESSEEFGTVQVLLVLDQLQTNLIKCARTVRNDGVLGDLLDSFFLEISIGRAFNASNIL